MNRASLTAEVGQAWSDSQDIVTRMNRASLTVEVGQAWSDSQDIVTTRMNRASLTPEVMSRAGMERLPGHCYNKDE